MGIDESTGSPPATPGPSEAAASAGAPGSLAARWIQDGWAWFEARGPGILGAMLLLVAAWVLAAWIRRVMVRTLIRAKVDVTLAKFLSNLAKWAIIIFSLITCAGTLGMSTTGFAAIIGAAGLAVGLALQGNLGNLASGVLLMIFRPFKIGDMVIIGGQTGIVDGIDLFTTYLDTPDNRRIYVPNNAVFNGVIENQTRHPTRRAVVTVPVYAGADIDKTREILMGAARRVAGSVPGALMEPAPTVVLTDISPASVWNVGVFMESKRFGAVREALLVEIKRALSDPSLVVPAQQLYVKELPTE